MPSTRDQRKAYVLLSNRALYVVALLIISSIIVALFTTMNNPTFASQGPNQYGASATAIRSIPSMSENTTSTPTPEFSSGLHIFLLTVAMLTGMFLVMNVYYKRIGKRAP